MDTRKAQELIAKFHEGTLSPEEEAIVDGWYLSLSDEERSKKCDEEQQSRKAVILSRLEEQQDTHKVVRLWPRIALSAAAVAAIAICIYFFAAPRNADSPAQPELIAKTQDIAPGKNGATITLANCKVIELSDVKTGVVVRKNLKYTDGKDLTDSLILNFFQDLRLARPPCLPPAPPADKLTSLLYQRERRFD